jgi:hypothetical protein
MPEKQIAKYPPLYTGDNDTVIKWSVAMAQFLYEVILYINGRLNNFEQRLDDGGL